MQDSSSLGVCSQIIQPSIQRAFSVGPLPCTWVVICCSMLTSSTAQDILKSFFAVTGEPSNFTYQKGWERIPENLYKTPVDWTVVQFNLDLVDWILQHPELGSIGGNAGEVNTFAGISLADPVTGIANVTNLLEGNNLICFALQVVKLAAPSYTNNIFKTLAAPLELILNALATPLLDLACPSWTALQRGGKPLLEYMQDNYPGANVSAL